MQDEKPGRNTQGQDRSREEKGRWPDAAGFRQGSQIRAGDPRRDPLALFGLCVQQYEALLVFAEELGYRDVLDGSCGRSRPVLLGRDDLEWDRNGGGLSGDYSTVTLLARLRGLSTSRPRFLATR